MYFSEHLRGLIEQKLTNCQSVAVEKNEYGIKIWCAVILEPNEDCFEVFSRTDAELDTLYKEAVSGADRIFVEKLETGRSDDNGLKWWIRYVAVPIVSGGVGAALVGWLLISI